VATIANAHVKGAIGGWA